MRDGDDRHIFLQFRPQRLLDDSIRFIINRGRRCSPNNVRTVVFSRKEDKRVQTFVEDEQFALAHHRPSQRDNLTLSDRKITPPTRHVSVKRNHTLLSLILDREKSGGTESGVQRRIVELVERIQVASEGATQKFRLVCVVNDVLQMRVNIGRRAILTT